MRIEHASLYTDNLERMKGFYERYFGAASGALYANLKTDFKSYFLSFGGSARLEIMSMPYLNASEGCGKTCGYAHIAFSAGSREDVDALTERLKTDGFTVASGPRVTGDGYYESCVLDPDGNSVEITI